MEAQEYLDQISSDMKPASAGGGGGILHSKFFIVGMIGVVGLILVLILGAILGAGKGGEKDKSMALLLHLDNTAAVAQEYQKSVKSSSLRSSSASLYGVLTNTSKALETYLTDKYNFKEKDIAKSTKSTAEQDKEKLSDELFEAKINGVLDRTFAHKMSYEISLLMNEESSIRKGAKNEELKSLLDESYGSLKNLYEAFNGFSEGK